LLANYLAAFHHWESVFLGATPEHIRYVLKSGLPTIIDTPWAEQNLTERRNQKFMAVESSDVTAPLIFMCHGVPPVWLNKAKWHIVDAKRI
jgi:hypothetical protein